MEFIRSITVLIFIRTWVLVERNRSHSRGTLWRLMYEQTAN